MIVKSFEIEKIKSIKNNFILLYGSNQGHKSQVIKELFERSFKGQISRFDENEILNNYEAFVSSLINNVPTYTFCNRGQEKTKKKNK